MFFPAVRRAGRERPGGPGDRRPDRPESRWRPLAPIISVRHIRYIAQFCFIPLDAACQEVHSNNVANGSGECRAGRYHPPEDQE